MVMASFALVVVVVVQVLVVAGWLVVVVGGGGPPTTHSHFFLLVQHPQSIQDPIKCAATGTLRPWLPSLPTSQFCITNQQGISMKTIFTSLSLSLISTTFTSSKSSGGGGGPQNATMAA